MNNTKQKSRRLRDRIFALVGVTGFEPTTSWSRTKRTTKLCHTPIFDFYKRFNPNPQLTLAVPKIAMRLGAARDFDRCELSAFASSSAGRARQKALVRTKRTTKLCQPN